LSTKPIAAWKKSLPMAATTSRLLAAPVIFAVLLSETPWANWWGAILFILGSLTDWLDGYWARLYQAETNMGKFMDPIADKILVLSVLIILLYRGRIDPIAPALLLSRDIFIGGLRSIAAADNVIIAAKPTGKWKTALQMIAVPCLFLSEQDFPLASTQIAGYTISLNTVGVVGLWVSVGLSLISGFDYTYGYFKGLKGKGAA
jgi:CDP-diacylglycerol--glycerol-3-phosphate 3-phosphatidyltransferase